MGSKIFRVHPLYNITGSETLQRELMSVVYVFIHDVVIMAGHTSDKCTAGLSVYPLFHQCFMALRKLRKIVPILLRRIFGHHCIRQIRWMYNFQLYISVKKSQFALCYIQYEILKLI